LLLQIYPPHWSGHPIGDKLRKTEICQEQKKTVNDYAEVTMSEPISSIDGVAQVSIFDQKQYVVRVQLDPKALASKGIGSDDVRSAIAAGNVNLPTGSLVVP
jgi:multidrug efflux pump subunit AcrB